MNNNCILILGLILGFNERSIKKMANILPNISIQKLITFLFNRFEWEFASIVSSQAILKKHSAQQNKHTFLQHFIAWLPTVLCRRSLQSELTLGFRNSLDQILCLRVSIKRKSALGIKNHKHLAFKWALASPRETPSWMTPLLALDLIKEIIRIWIKNNIYKLIALIQSIGHILIDVSQPSFDYGIHCDIKWLMINSMRSMLLNDIINLWNPNQFIILCKHSLSLRGRNSLLQMTINLL